MTVAVRSIGKRASILFSTLSFEQINSSQLSTLCEIREFDARWINGVGVATVAEIGRHQAAVEAKVILQNRRIEELMRRMDELTGQVGQMQETIQQQNETIAGHEKRINDLNGQVDQMQRTIAGHERRITELNGQVSQMQQTIRQQNETIAGYERRINDLNGQVGQMQRTIAGHERWISDLNGQVDQMQRPIAGHERWMSELNGQVSHMQETIARHARRFAVFEARGIGRCSLTIHGTRLIPQAFYYCQTCGFTGGDSFCEVCKDVCHRGHDVTRAPHGRGFCDCGARGAGRCHCLC
jgi:predicted  nucleic acid-binding Zn-ribbon protein